jgi:hypothetical protein
VSTSQQHPFSLAGAAPLSGTVWAAGGSRPAVLLVSNNPPDSGVAPALARAGFAVVSWERPRPGTEDIGRIRDALGAGALPVRTSSYALMAGQAGARDAIHWATTDRQLGALVTWGMTLTREERAAVIEEAHRVTCPWLLLADERDKSAEGDARALVASGPARILAHAPVRAPEGFPPTWVHIAIAWLARHV